MKLAGGHVLVTGAGSGIGLATALAVAARGAVVSAVDIDGSAAERAAKRIVQAGGRAHAFDADVASEVAVGVLARRVTALAGPVDVLVNNAGVAVVAPFLETRPEDWDWVFGVNVGATVQVTRAFLPSMLARRRGHVVVVASLAGLVAAPGMVAYSTTKFAAVGFAEALRHEVEPQGVGVTVVCPGYVRTNLHRATRYENDAFERFLDRPPAFYGLTQDDVGERIARAVERETDLLVLGPEKVGHWLKRLAPSVAQRMTRFVARRVGIMASPGAIDAGMPKRARRDARPAAVDTRSPPGDHRASSARQSDGRSPGKASRASSAGRRDGRSDDASPAPRSGDGDDCPNAPLREGDTGTCTHS